jgi:ribosomal protein L19
MNKIIEQFEAEQITRQLPEFGPGDTVVVNVKVKEGNRERVQAFEGIVIAAAAVCIRPLPCARFRTAPAWSACSSRIARPSIR